MPRTPAATTALAAVRAHRTSACLIALLAGAGAAFLVPLLGLFTPFDGESTTLRFSSVPAFGYDLGWTRAAVPPAAMQQAAVRQLFELLISSGILTFAVFACSILLVAASIAGERAAELAVRRAIGASRRTLLAAALAEAAMLGATALAGGGIVAAWLAREAAGSWPGSAVEGGIGAAPAFLAAGAVLVVAALLPLLHRAQRRLTGSLAQPPGLVVPSVQLGLALAVLTAAGIVAIAADRLAATDSNHLPAGVRLTIDAMPDVPAERAEQYERVIAALRDRPGVEAVSLTSPGQMVGLGVVDFLRTDCGRCPRGGIMLPWLELNGTVQMVSSDTFRARGFGLLAGRGFRADDRVGAEPVAVVNRYLAARWFEDGDAVGRDVFVGADWKRARHRVVGIVDDERSSAFGGRGLPLETVYLSVLQHPPTAAEILLTGGGATAPATMLTEVLEREAAPGLWFGRWFGVEGWAMLSAAVLGVFAFMRRWAFALAPEIALHRASGATRRRMAVFVGLRAAGVGVAGAAVGLVFFGPALWSAVSRAIPGASAWEPGIVARFAVLLVLATLAGAALPAWQVLRRAPAEDLGAES